MAGRRYGRGHGHASSARRIFPARLAARFDIRHVTVKIELEGCADESVTASG